MLKGGAGRVLRSGTRLLLAGAPAYTFIEQMSAGAWSSGASYCCVCSHMISSPQIPSSPQPCVSNHK